MSPLCKSLRSMHDKLDRAFPMMSAHCSPFVLQGYSLPHIDVFPDAWLGKAGLLIRSNALRSTPLKSSGSKLCSVLDGSLDCFDLWRRLHAKRRRLRLRLHMREIIPSQRPFPREVCPQSRTLAQCVQLCNKEDGPVCRWGLHQGRELTRCATSLMSFSSCGIMKTTLYGKFADVCFPL